MATSAFLHRLYVPPVSQLVFTQVLPCWTRSTPAFRKPTRVIPRSALATRNLAPPPALRLAFHARESPSPGNRAHIVPQIGPEDLGDAAAEFKRMIRGLGKSFGGPRRLIRGPGRWWARLHWVVRAPGTLAARLAWRSRGPGRSWARLHWLIRGPGRWTATRALADSGARKMVGTMAMSDRGPGRWSAQLA